MSGLVQLVSRGIEDEMLTGKPLGSFFQGKYTRYSQFSNAILRQGLEGIPIAGGMSTIKIDKKGDLLSYAYLTAQDSAGVVRNIDWTSNIIDKIQLWIGAQMIDQQDSVWTNNIEPVVGAATPSQARQPAGISGSSQGFNSNSFYPLKFFFCKNWAAALPLVALQFNEVVLKIFWSSNLNKVPTGVSTAAKYSSLQYMFWGNFIYLDQAERDYIAHNKRVMLMHQVQRQLVPSSGNQVELYFSNSVKYLAFQSNVYTTGSGLTMKAQVNGVDVSDYLSLCQWIDVPQFYHTPNGFSGTLSNVAIVPYCLNTARFQPTGTLNFSRLDTYRLVTSGNKFQDLTLTADNTQPAYIYAVNYNFLKIEAGVGSLLYLT
jgi:hypothetical protein